MNTHDSAMYPAITRQLYFDLRAFDLSCYMDYLMLQESDHV